MGQIELYRTLRQNAGIRTLSSVANYLQREGEKSAEPVASLTEFSDRQ
jgi:hypothetical protein